MKNVWVILFFSGLFTSLTSCNKDRLENLNFYDAEYRKGIWISRDKKDTLDFIDDSNLVRKGDFYTNEEYMYRIEDQILYIKSLGFPYETQHPILKVENNSIVIGNMYISSGFLDNSGTFIKININ